MAAVLKTLKSRWQVCRSMVDSFQRAGQHNSWVDKRDTFNGFRREVK